MTQHFLTYEQSLAVKELGFDEPCLSYYEGESFSDHLVKIKNDKEDDEDSWYITAAPLKSQFFKWVRDKYSWQASIQATSDQHSHNLGYNYWIWNYNTGEEHWTEPRDRPLGDWEYETYEQAEDACINKIIELLKNKK